MIKIGAALGTVALTGIVGVGYYVMQQNEEKSE
jgi:hypothetical protein